MTSEGKKPSEVVRDAVSGKQEANESKDQGAHAALDSAAHRSGGANEAPAVRGRGPLDPTRSVVRTRPLPAKPRRVRAGVKLSRAELDYHDSPTAARWLELAMATIKPAMREEALEYARSGQAKRLELGPGRVVAPIQGRMPGAYTTRLEFDTISAKQWDAVVDAMGAQAKFAATLIAGHLTGDLIKLFESLGSSLVQGAIRPSCTCAERRVAYEAANPVSTPPATAPASAALSIPSGNGKKASLAITQSEASSPAARPAR